MTAAASELMVAGSIPAGVAKELRSASRAGPPSGLQDGSIGFRVARSPPDAP